MSPLQQVYRVGITFDGFLEDEVGPLGVAHLFISPGPRLVETGKRVTHTLVMQEAEDLQGFLTYVCLIKQTLKSKQTSKIKTNIQSKQRIALHNSILVVPYQ